MTAVQLVNVGGVTVVFAVLLVFAAMLIGFAYGRSDLIPALPFVIVTAGVGAFWGFMVQAFGGKS